MISRIIEEEEKLRDAFQLFCTVLDDLGNMGIVKNFGIDDKMYFK